MTEYEVVLQLVDSPIDLYSNCMHTTTLIRTDWYLFLPVPTVISAFEPYASDHHIILLVFCASFPQQWHASC